MVVLFSGDQTRDRSSVIGGGRIRTAIAGVLEKIVVRTAAGSIDQLRMIELKTNIGHANEHVASKSSRPCSADVQIRTGQISVSAAIFQVPLLVEVGVIWRGRICISMA